MVFSTYTVFNFQRAPTLPAPDTKSPAPLILPRR